MNVEAFREKGMKAVSKPTGHQDHNINAEVIKLSISGGS